MCDELFFSFYIHMYFLYRSRLFHAVTVSRPCVLILLLLIEPLRFGGDDCVQGFWLTAIPMPVHLWLPDIWCLWASDQRLRSSILHTCAPGPAACSPDWCHTAVEVRTGMVVGGGGGGGIFFFGYSITFSCAKNVVELQFRLKSFWCLASWLYLGFSGV